MPVFFEKAIIGNSSGCFQPQKRKLKIFLKKEKNKKWKILKNPNMRRLKCVQENETRPTFSFSLLRTFVCSTEMCSGDSGFNKAHYSLIFTLPPSLLFYFGTGYSKKSITLTQPILSGWKKRD